MYCPRCQIELGENKYCENCGLATIRDNEVLVSTQSIPQPIHEEIEAHKINTSKIKKVISLIILLGIVTGLSIGYNILKKQYTPKSVVEKYYKYLANKEYDKAYSLLANTDNDFLSKDMFENSMKVENFRKYKIRNYNPDDILVTYNPEIPQNNVKEGEGIFSVEVGAKLYTTTVISTGKKLLFFKDYKIIADNFTTQWSLTTPKGSKLLINGKNYSISSQSNIDSFVDSTEKYKPKSNTYKIDKIFNGKYDITGTMEGAKEFKLDGALAGQKINVKFEPTEELTKQLQEQAKKFLELYYSNASQDKYLTLITKDSNVLSRLVQSQKYNSDKIINKLDKVEVTNKFIDDVEHARINVNCFINYEDSSMAEWGLSKQTGENMITTEVYFEKQNNKWLIVDVGYINYR